MRVCIALPSGELMAPDEFFQRRTVHDHNRKKLKIAVLSIYKKNAATLPSTYTLSNEKTGPVRQYDILKGANVRYLICLLLLLALSGCADYVPLDKASAIPKVGFWFGLWHGIIFPFAWVVSLFDDSTAIYAVYNNGGWYDFGFFLGVGGFSASLLASKKKK